MESLGRALHQPLTSTTEVRQRYRLPTGEVQGTQVVTGRGLSAATRQALLARRAQHQGIARDLALQLKAIREQVEKRFRFQPEGRLDRRRLVAADKGAGDVHTRLERHPKTSFVASIAVDLSGSMKKQKESGALFDATMVLGDTFDQLNVPHEIRAFSDGTYQYKSLGDKVVDLERAGRLTADGGGSTKMAATAALSTLALRARAEKNKLAIFLSDGDLDDHRDTVTILNEARQHGVLPYGIFLGNPSSVTKIKLDQLYGTGNWRAIQSLKEMPRVVGQHLAMLYRALGSKGT